MKTSANYDEISTVYEERYKVSPLEGIHNYLKNIITQHTPFKVLEVGCGTGYWLNSLLGIKHLELYGVDFSIGMLYQAKKNTNKQIYYFNADANYLPLKSNSFDLIICINAIHHFSNFKLFIKNAASLLKHNGLLSVIGLDPHDMKTEWYLYDYFVGTYELDLNRYPPLEQLQKQFHTVGLSNVHSECVHKHKSSKYGREVLDDHFISKKGASQLALLTDEEYELGIQKIKHDIELAEEEERQTNFITKLNFYSVTGTKLSS